MHFDISIEREFSGNSQETCKKQDLLPGQNKKLEPDIAAHLVSFFSKIESCVAGWLLNAMKMIFLPLTLAL